ncbi:MAG: tetratricopeptide repeat protein, partial [Bacteroidetes bacterium]|nr:tetratricopeptide repeat protein [Bacteroidota bacterium]
MKRLLLLYTLFCFADRLTAQTTEDAENLFYHHRYNSAGTALHALIAKDPNNVHNWWLLAQVYLEQNRTAALKDTLQLAPPAVAGDPLLRAVKGHILLGEKDSAGAAVYFAGALKDTKMKDPAVLAEVARAQVDVKEGNAAYAIDLLEKAIKKDKDNPALYVLQGDAWRKLADGGNAYKAYEEALKQNPSYAAASYKIGKIYTSQNNPDLFVPSFDKAVTLDSMYAPALYELYYFYYFKDANMAMDYLRRYLAASDYDPQHDFLLTDMLYTQGKYQQAIAHADELVKKQIPGQARLYKLIAYSYQALGRPDTALVYMNEYFHTNPDTAYALKDYEAMGEIYSALPGREDSAAVYYAKAAALEKEPGKQLAYYKKLGQLYKKIKAHDKEAFWLGKYYAANPAAGNVDLFNWGIASYLAKDYAMADSVFTMYENKYPKEEFGYYWSARSAAAIDTSMAEGLAVPHYLKLLELAADTSVHISTKHQVEAYGYIAAYKANTEKNYNSAIDYFEKLLELEPDNDDAKKYVTILKKNI